jgi:hypothetical protein
MHRKIIPFGNDLTKLIDRSDSHAPVFVTAAAKALQRITVSPDNISPPSFQEFVKSQRTYYITLTNKGLDDDGLKRVYKKLYGIEPR